MQGGLDLFKKYLEEFLYYFIPFAEKLLSYLRKNVFPYLTEVMSYLQRLSEKMPVNFELYILIFIILVILGVIVNWKLEGKEEEEKKKKEKKEISDLLFTLS
ncbi:MAG: hypothetical protein J7J30_05140 [Candidatus Odinarchaeota archaeon]|nr:hypothetical protein [Candidatus Odinarchaeota archaeon]